MRLRFLEDDSVQRGTERKDSVHYDAIPREGTASAVPQRPHAEGASAPEGSLLEIEIEDHGTGFAAVNVRQGIGLVAMRERAQLVNGSIEFLHPPSGGTLVRLHVPREVAETHA